MERKMRVFFDTNILLDQLDHRRTGYTVMLELEPLLSQKGIQPMCAWHSLSIIEYIGKKVFPAEVIHQILRGITQNYVIPSVGSAEAREAFTYLKDDFEDAMQIATARAGRATYIITNDKKFATSPIPVVTSQEFLQILQQG